MSGDEQHDVGVSLEWSAHGFSGKIKSRLLSALDRLGARRIDASNLAADRESSVTRALTDTQVSLIKAASQAIENQIQDDPRLAAKLLQSLSRAEHDAENIGASLAYMLEDLRNDQSSAASSNGQEAETLSAETVNRWERYASEAETDEIRQKWGKVLASEIRAPGTFSLQTLRIIDEIDSDVARLFERLCTNQINAWIPHVTAGISAKEVDELQHAGLIYQSDFPGSITFNDTTKSDGSEWWIAGSERASIAVSKMALGSQSGRQGGFSLDDVRISEGKLQANVYLLTRPGVAISTIVPSDGGAVRRFGEAVSQTLGREHVVLLKRDDANELIADDEWSAVAAGPSEPRSATV